MLQDPSLLPSARVLEVMRRDHGDSFTGFTRSQSLQARQKLLALPFSAAQQARFDALRAASVQEQKEIEARDSMPFELYRQQYISAERLGLGKAAVAPALAAV
jgi:glutamate--cysteine ligase